MSINWVMLQEPQGFVRLPGEKPLYKSPPRTTFALTTPRLYPGNDQAVSVHSDSGTLHLTNQRVIYLPTRPTSEFKSFSSPILNLVDAHIEVPWFGPNAWQALVMPVPGGHLPATSSGIELKLTFKEGGVTDFHTNFERIKERLQQAVDVAQTSGTSGSRQTGFLNGVNMASVHLDQLPSYEDSGHDKIASNDHTPAPGSSTTPDQGNAHGQAYPNTRDDVTQPPVDAPPGYEETQQQSVQEALDRRFSGRQND